MKALAPSILAIAVVLCSKASAQDRPAVQRPAPAFSNLSGAIQSALSSAPKTTQNWYKARGNQPVWNGKAIGGLADLLRRMERHGLNPELFRFSEWDATWRQQAPTAALQAQVDVGTTQVAVAAIDALLNGWVNPTDVHPKWKRVGRNTNAFAILDAALQKPDRFADSVESMAAPPDPRYRELMAALGKYRQISGAGGGWKNLPPTSTTTVEIGQPYKAIGLLRARLRAEGDLLPNAPKIKSKTLDAGTSAALKSFQFRHGIEPDGVIGPQTLVELNTPTADRIEQIAINLERLRWMPRNFEQGAHLEVNIAESALRIFSGAHAIDTMEVIVGVKGKTQTPVFHGQISYLIFRPYWNMPLSIAKNEIVPMAMKDASYCARNNYEIVPFFGVDPSKALPITTENLQKVASGKLVMRQGTGPDNALGLVKFIFPNDSAVYLHDTPDHSLFKKTDRDFSHGCVRVSRPDQLAMFLLQPNGGWSFDQVTYAMKDQTSPSKKVNLSRKTPVYLAYWTCTIMNDGRLRFDQDIYGHDAVMREKLGLVMRATDRPAAAR